MGECVKLHYWVLELQLKYKMSAVFWVDILLKTNEEGYWTFDIDSYCKYLNITRKELNTLLRVFKSKGVIEYERIGRKRISVFLVDWDSYQC